MAIAAAPGQVDELRAAKVLKALQAKGCRFLREGSRHTILEAAGGGRVEVPRHRIIRRGTARNIARQAGIEWHEFEQAVS